MEILEEAAFILKPALDDQTYGNVLVELCKTNLQLILEDKLFVDRPKLNLLDFVPVNSQPFKEADTPEAFATKLFERITLNTMVRLLERGYIPVKYQTALITQIAHIGGSDTRAKLRVATLQLNLSKEALMVLLEDRKCEDVVNIYALLNREDFTPREFAMYIASRTSFRLEHIDKYSSIERLESEATVSKLLFLFNLYKNKIIFPGTFVFSIYRGKFHYPHLYTSELRETVTQYAVSTTSSWVGNRNGAFNFTLAGLAIINNDREYLNADWKMFRYQLPSMFVFLQMETQYYKNVVGTKFYNEMIGAILQDIENNHMALLPTDHEEAMCMILKDALGTKLFKFEYLTSDADAKRRLIRDLIKHDVHISVTSPVFSALYEPFKFCEDLKEYGSNDRMIVDTIVTKGEKYLAGINVDNIINRNAKQRLMKYLLGKVI